MCLFEEVCVYVWQCVLILYPYLQICPCCLSDPLLPSHLISPSFCPPNTLPLCVFICLWVFWINISKYCSKQSVPHTECAHSRWITYNLPLPLLLSPEKGSTQTHLKQKSMHQWASEDIPPSLYLTISNNLLCVEKLFFTMFHVIMKRNFKIQ